MPQFTSLAISDPRDLLFGIAPKPLKTRKGMVIGGGQVYPELNFTLPPMDIDAHTMPEILQQYRDIISGAATRAVELECPGLVIEFETLPPMTQEPQWGIDITKVLVEGLEDAHAKHGLKSTLRATPNDIREFDRPPRMKSGKLWDDMMTTFRGCAKAGAELLSIESVGGKEVHDDALVMGDMPGVIFSLCVMGVRDMKYLWDALAVIGRENQAICAGDTACGFGNTAMVLADRQLISRAFAAVVRAISAVRSLVAYECGAMGPGKDCGYENIILKAITGMPMAMEGKTSACAHLSPVGNVAAAAADTWSNESVQNIKLLGAMAPTVYVEQLIYDCRLFNRALADGKTAARQLQKWLVDSDASLDPQAYILTPFCAVELAKTIVATLPRGYYAAGKAAALKAVDLIQQAHKAGQVKLPPREATVLDSVKISVEELPDNESAFIELMLGQLDTSKFSAEDYGLA